MMDRPREPDDSSEDQVTADDSSEDQVTADDNREDRENQMTE